MPPKHERVENEHDDGRFLTCENCLRGIMPGERYHGGGEVDICADCAPAYQDMIDDPGQFWDENAEEHMTEEEAREICDAHCNSGGQLSDKILTSEAPGGAE